MPSSPSTTTPSSSTTTPSPSSTKQLPLHTKSIERINIDELINLSTDRDDIQLALTNALRYLDDITMYESVPRRSAAGCPQTKLSGNDVRQLVQNGVLVPIDKDDVRGHFNLFAVDELHKQRRRPIKCPTDINLFMGKETVDKNMSIAGKKQVLDIILEGNYYADIDGASFFDQFEVSAEVGALMCCRKHNKYYRVGTAPMGQRQVVQIAQRAMQKVNYFAGARAKRAICIDNAIFVGTYQDVLHDLNEVMARAKQVNMTINDDGDDHDLSHEHRIATTGEWGGIAFDLATKQVWLTEKVHRKIEASWGNRDRWTYRGFAAHIGLLFWAVGIIHIPMAEYYQIMRFVSRIGQLLTAQPELWDTKIDVWPSALHDLQAWTERCLDNEPRVHSRHAAGELDWIITTDASAHGWGYVACNVKTGEVRQHGERWPYPFRREHRERLRQSTFTEPHGVYNSCCHLLRRTDTKQHILVGTDNISTKVANTKGWSGAFTLNHCVLRLRSTFPPHLFSFEFRYIKGALNVHADAQSRGASTSAEEGQIAQDLRQWAGTSDDHEQPSSPQ